MLTLPQLAEKIHPDRTVLLMGAGAAITSGAPTGVGLAQQLAAQLSPRPTTSELSQVCGIWEMRNDRRSLVEAVKKILQPLEPSNALLTLPNFPWRNIYSTNFDQLVEKSYNRADRELSVIRSNYEFGQPIMPGVTRLFKIHGCVTQDVSLGNPTRMVLTERDYDQVREYREAIFRALAYDIVTADVLVIGQSLADAHLRQMAKDSAALRTTGTTGQIYMMVYDRDEDQASLLEQFGIHVCFGSLENLFHALNTSATSKLVATSISPIAGVLPPRLAVACQDVAHSSGLPSNPVRLFNGGSATYGDIAAGLTAERAVERRFAESQDSAKGFFTVLTGVAGVGKTTLVRRVLHARSKAGFLCWEALDAFPLDIDGWMEVDGNLRRSGRQGFLFIDDATRNLNPINRLVERLAALPRPHLRVVITAHGGLWRSLYKAPAFFSRGTQTQLGRLTEVDLGRLITLVDAVPLIAALVEPSFRNLNQQQKLSRLRDRCSSEMFVCLKNIFGSTELDYILLDEFATLGIPEREIYRHVAVLQAMGAKVHRQLILRCLNIEVGHLEALLTLLEGIVDELPVDERTGLYRWSVRHDVIARVIAQYKFAESEDLSELLERIIVGLNPSIHMEVETARALCTTDWGIPRLPTPELQISLLLRLISVLPAERIPRRRLIRRYLDSRQLDDAGQAIKAARAALPSADWIVDRYEIMMLLFRAEDDSRFLPEDRYAILADALAKCKLLVGHGADKQNIRVLADVSVAIARRSGDVSELLLAIDELGRAEDELLDPDLGRMALHYTRIARSLAKEGAPDLAADEIDLEFEMAELTDV